MALNDELALVAQAKQGDLDAFSALYELHKTAIYRTALAITGEKMQAEEILQETFLRAYRHIQKMHDGVSLSPWLYRVAVNLAYDLTAKKKRGTTIINTLIERLTVQPLTSPERKLEERELQDLLYEAINKLEFKQRATLVLFYLQNFSMLEIAEIMDCPVGTVKSRLHYARLNLRKELLADTRLAGGWAYEFP